MYSEHDSSHRIKHLVKVFLCGVCRDCNAVVYIVIRLSSLLIIAALRDDPSYYIIHSIPVHIIAEYLYIQVHP